MNTGFAILKLKETKSTNDFAKELCSSNDLPNFYTILAEMQTGGRGQRENIWHSKAGKNLLFSIITKPSFLEITSQFYLSKVISLGIIEYLNLKEDNFKIKWPNDIYYNDKKICGILIENSISGSTIKNSIIGIGLNVNQENFPNYLPNAISLSNIFNKYFSLESEFELLLNKIYDNYLTLKNNNFKKIDDLYHKHLYRINELSKFKDENGIFKGTITGTLPEGKLIITNSNNEIKKYNFKEVEFL